MDATQTKRILDWDYQKDGTLETDFTLTAAASNKTKPETALQAANPEVDYLSCRLIVTYSQKRADRSRNNRDRLIKKLQAKLDRNQVVKKSKYIILDMPEDNAADKASSKAKKKAKALSGHLDTEKLEADARFDGLKGYVTNTKLGADEVVAHYGNLWHVEKSFRMSKFDLKARSAFHYKRERIIAHLAICVCSLASLRVFEQKLQTIRTIPNPGLSIALEQLLAMREYKVAAPGSTTSFTMTTELSELQQQLLRLSP